MPQPTLYKHSLILDTPDGDVEGEVVFIVYDYPTHVKTTLSLIYGDNEYIGYGDDYLFLKAFALLERSLPEGVSMKCCLNCRYGNMCPTGNTRNEVFCIKRDILRGEESEFVHDELTRCTSRIREREARSREYCECCPDYVRQDRRYFTFSSYLKKLEI